MNYLDCAQYDCCHNKAGCCCADHVSIDECSCGPECATRAPKENNE